MKSFPGLIAIALAGVLLLAASPVALAESWYPVATTADGQQRQYVDIDSIERSPQGVRLRSFWEDRATQASALYLTEYDCERQQYRDLPADSPKTDQAARAKWKSLTGDPLNYAAMKYGCSYR